MHTFLMSRLSMSLMLCGSFLCVWIVSMSACTSMARDEIASNQAGANLKKNSMSEQRALFSQASSGGGAPVENKKKWQFFANDKISTYYLDAQSHWSASNGNVHKVGFKRTYNVVQSNKQIALPYLYEKSTIDVRCKSKYVGAQVVEYYDLSGQQVDAAISTGSVEVIPASVADALLKKYCSL